MKSFVKVWLGVALITIGIGIVILVVSFCAGVSWTDFTFNRMSFTSEDVPNYSLKESYTDIKNIDFNIQYGEVKIIKGNTFSIDAKHFPENGIESYVSDGTWTIDTDVTTDNYIKVFGFKIPASDFYHWDEFSPQVTITIPENFSAENFNMVVSAGDVKADEIMAQEGYLEVSAGRISVDKLEISGSSEYHIGAGQIEVERANINNITVDCGVGNVVIEGTITGDNDITCDIGSVKLKLNGDEEDYSYDVSADIGSVEINHHNYQGTSEEVINNNGADYNLSLECNIGNITVDFN